MKSGHLFRFTNSISFFGRSFGQAQTVTHSLRRFWTTAFARILLKALPGYPNPGDLH